LENKVVEPITLLALKIFNSLPKPMSKQDEWNQKVEKRKSVDNRSELMGDGEKTGFAFSGNSVSQSKVSQPKVALPKSNEEEKADKENVTNKGFERDVHLTETILVANEPVNINFGDKLSAPPSETVSSSNTDRDNGEKIRFRPRKNYLSQILRHTQELGLVQKLGDIFTLFPERKEDHHKSTQSEEHLISPPMWIKKRTVEKENFLKKTPEHSVLLQKPKEASLLPRQPPMQIQGQPVNYMH